MSARDAFQKRIFETLKLTQLPAALNGTLQPLNQTNANPSWAWTAGGGISTAGAISRST